MFDRARKRRMRERSPMVCSPCSFAERFEEMDEEDDEAKRMRHSDNGIRIEE